MLSVSTKEPPPIARARGQLFHYHIEQFLNGRTIEEPQSPELRQALVIHDEIRRQ